MTSYEALRFVLSYWEEVGETDEAMAEELSSYGEDFLWLAQDYAQAVIDDHDYWSDEWVERAKQVRTATEEA